MPSGEPPKVEPYAPCSDADWRNLERARDQMEDDNPNAWGFFEELKETEVLQTRMVTDDPGALQLALTLPALAPAAATAKREEAFALRSESKSSELQPAISLPQKLLVRSGGRV